MRRVLLAVVTVALGAFLTGVHSAAPPARDPLAALPLVDRMYAEVSFPQVDDPKTTLFEVLEQVTKLYGVEFDVNERAFKYEMLVDVLRVEVANPNPLPAIKAPLYIVLQRILAKIAIPSGGTWLLRKHHVEITTAAFARTEMAGKDRVIIEEDLDETMGDNEEGVYYLALPLFNGDFRKTPLAEALAKVADRIDRNIVLDETVVKEYGVRPVTASLRNVRLDAAVLLLASQAELGVARLDNTYLVTTKEKAGDLAKRLAEMRPVRKPRRAPTSPAAPPKEIGPLNRFGSGIGSIPRK